MDITVCLVCKNSIQEDEFSSFDAEFRDYPAHQECFDGFDDADQFLTFARNEVNK